jgi:hypothetical protein
MHAGCNGNYTNGCQIVDKIRMMGFNNMAIGSPLDMTCTACNTDFVMKTMESICPSCNMVYGVTPCHANSASNVLAAGINY